MPVYIALLRGINVGAHKRMKMEKLIASCTACGWTEAKTYIQSGNIVLTDSKASSAAIAKKLEAQILAEFGFSCDVIVRSAHELGKIISGNPLLKLRSVDPEKLHVVFLPTPPTSEAVKKLESLTLPPDLVRVADTEIYFYFPNGVSGSSLWKHPLDKVLKVSGTMRNWNTANKLREMAEEMAE